VDLILRNAWVVDPVNRVSGLRDLAIEDGAVVEVGEGLPAKAVIEQDCRGRTVLPGVIDMHVHVTKGLGGHNGYRMIARTGVTTAVDFAGPIADICENLPQLGCGMNLACVDSLLPENAGHNPGPGEVSAFYDSTLEQGSLGAKILGGHFPLTPDASRLAIEAANQRHVMVAFHAGTTHHRSDIYGMREAIELAEGNRMLLAHINAYCRGKHYPYLEELQMAFAMLRENPNIISDSHLASMNGTVGYCAYGLPHDVITTNCLELFGRPATEQGLAEAILDGLVRVQAETGGENVLLEREEGHRYWREHGTQTMVSFPANIPAVGIACVLERFKLGGDFLIQMTSTDGGGIPRNNLIGRMLNLYHLGYLSLEEVVLKTAVNPAAAFGFTQKGHLGVGAHADITVLDKGRYQAVQSFARGKEIMRNGEITGSGGCLMVTECGADHARKQGLDYSIAQVAAGMLYRDMLH